MGIVESGTTQNAIIDNYEFLEAALRRVGSKKSGPLDTAFFPEFKVPRMDARLAEFFGAADVSVTRLGSYRGKDVTFLNLMRNPRTRTTWTLPSHVMVARAIRHIWSTGEPITLLTPSSANKGTALRDAVLRAIECGLVSADDLQMVTLIPESARDKLWSSSLNEDSGLRARNPVAIYSGDEPSNVKKIAREFVDQYGKEFTARTGRRLWYTLDIDNYRAVDALRAAVERRLAPTAGRRIHVHAVSSAYGLLGHHFGRSLLSGTGGEAGDPPPSYFLVQHLGRPEMVLNLYHGDFSNEHVPDYRLDGEAGLYRQDQEAHFPHVADDPEEFLDITFYAYQAATSSDMNDIIAKQGGGGIVVSRRECLDRYNEITKLLAPAGITLPSDPARLRDWSLVMAAAGLLLGVDRRLIDAEDDVLLHGSGSYTQDDFTPIPGHHLHGVDDAQRLRTVVFESAER
ncbi:hypothetical protein CDO52_14745 [Nocardiopsis gilva YIM 90087]|uniref:Uncharacterized protein n=1 Tax=Nocardiopsis gilva YIM 90087 TaxID=1235441 RepID=A0A223S6Y5_9ACTN|nr:DUF6002 family protein [Nocardiopsis gilva]ASU83873.1 hypothetical protein CDO52_14745 [Nocardiopsis gilva YIM 90087]